MRNESQSNKYGAQWILIKVYFNRGTIKKVGRVQVDEGMKRGGRGERDLRRKGGGIARGNFT